MKNLSTDQIRQSFIKFFTEKHSHLEIQGSSIIPEDNSVLLTSAGMQQLIPYLMGKKHPLSHKLCSIQKCFRTTDLESIGDESHNSYFEMLGNWSLGEYFKKTAIQMAWQYLTEELEIPVEKLSVTIFKGNKNIPYDQEAKDHWTNIGMPEDRITSLGVEDNFWIAGDTGPCGGDTEIFYDTGKGKIEIWNLVFMEYYKDEQGNYTKLEKQNVDTGAGLTRLAMVVQAKNDIYETDEIYPIIAYLEKATNKKYRQDEQPTRAMRIIADHIRAIIIMIDAGIRPSNLGREYLLRRLIRRCVRYCRLLELPNGFLGGLLDIAIPLMPLVKSSNTEIKNIVATEARTFEATIVKGLKELEKMKTKTQSITGEQAFYLYETYGFPFELTKEITGQEISQEDYDLAARAHQEISRAAIASKAGGVGGDEAAAPNHTATHLLHQALRIVLGPEVAQCGSDVTPERLRFDFNYPDKLTDEQIKKVTEIVNEQINRSLPVVGEEMTHAEAKSKGAIGLFDEKYEDKVSVYSIGDFSKEICMGPHAKNTSQLKNFKILSEKSSSKGIRRIKAITNF